MIPDPVVEEREPGVFVVRDDLLMGGTKRCYADQLIRGHREVVYASPAYGGAQIAIAWSAREPYLSQNEKCLTREHRRRFGQGRRSCRCLPDI
jgi:hypothetical protein